MKKILTDFSLIFPSAKYMSIVKQEAVEEERNELDFVDFCCHPYICPLTSQVRHCSWKRATLEIKAFLGPYIRRIQIEIQTEVFFYGCCYPIIYCRASGWIRDLATKWHHLHYCTIGIFNGQSDINFKGVLQTQIGHQVCQNRFPVSLGIELGNLTISTRGSDNKKSRGRKNEFKMCEIYED